MAPSAISAAATPVKPARSGGPKFSWPASTSNSHEATSTVAKPEEANRDTELASAFKSDLTNIRDLATCSICDQLLYEPWTLSCGHTYCYSCLTNWFVQNKRKKTCPECRTAIKQLPAPNFLVKQMVEIFCKRSEIMPSDESIEQHHKKRAEEIAEVDKDKANPAGLFKGAFNIRPRAELLYDEIDGVLRCPQCQHEHEGGLECNVCGTRFEENYEFDEDDAYGFSDVDDDADLDLDLADLEADIDGHHHGSHILHALGVPHFPFGNHRFHPLHHHHHEDSVGDSSGSGDSSDGSDIDGYSEEDEDDEGSLQDFIVQDEDNENDGATNARNNRPLITISDDESDEGGPVAPRRRHRTNRRDTLSSSPRRHGSSPSVASVHTFTDSENGETNPETVMLRDAGWSPLDTENDSDGEEALHYASCGFALAEEQQDSDDESDTNTMRNGPSDDEDDHDGEVASIIPTYQYNGETYFHHQGTPSSYASDDESHRGAVFPHSMDGDGDTEMSASPGPSNLSRGGSVSTNGYGGYDGGEIYDDSDDEGTPRRYRGSTASTNGYGNMGEHLGQASEIHDIEDDSSEGSIQPPPRRRPRQRMGNPRVQQTDPRISIMFAEHQQSLRGAHNQQQGLDEVEVEVRRAEPASRNRRMTAYRVQPLRRGDPLRSARAPSATRIISSSNRVARPPRQYQRRYH